MGLFTLTDCVREPWPITLDVKIHVTPENAAWFCFHLFFPLISYPQVLVFQGSRMSTRDLFRGDNIGTELLVS